MFKFRATCQSRRASSGWSGTEAEHWDGPGPPGNTHNSVTIVCLYVGLQEYFQGAFSVDSHGMNDSPPFKLIIMIVLQRWPRLRHTKFLWFFRPRLGLVAKLRTRLGFARSSDWHFGAGIWLVFDYSARRNSKVVLGLELDSGFRFVRDEFWDWLEVVSARLGTLLDLGWLRLGERLRPAHWLEARLSSVIDSAGLDVRLRGWGLARGSL